MSSPISYISPGDIVVTSRQSILQSTPLGSCLALIAFDSDLKLGGMAHIMLPGEPKYGNNSNDPRYSIPAIEKIEKELNKSGSSLALSKIALIGGANVLRKEIDELTPLIISSTQEKLFRMGGKIHFQDTGGFLRRSVWVEIPTGLINYSTGNDIQKKTLYL